MGLSKRQFNAVIAEIKDIIPDFQYRTGIPTSEYVDEHGKPLVGKYVFGVYYSDKDTIKLQKPSFYANRQRLASTIWHELAHWAMVPGRVGHLAPYYAHTEFHIPLEEIIAEKVSRELCAMFGPWSSKSHNEYISEYRAKLHYRCSKKEYKECIAYTEQKAAQVIKFLLKEYKKTNS